MKSSLFPEPWLPSNQPTTSIVHPWKNAIAVGPDQHQDGEIRRSVEPFRLPKILVIMSWREGEKRDRIVVQGIEIPDPRGKLAPFAHATYNAIKDCELNIYIESKNY